jgi:rod shape determining protein RodA
MAVGIAPVVGVPLPLVSYGGTSIIATFLAIGLLLNIQTRRFMLFY